MADRATITIGADPEFILLDEMSMELVSAVDLIPGTKEAPVEFAKLGKGYNYHRDNVLLEVGVPPTSDPYQFVDNINNVYGESLRMLETLDPDRPHLTIYRNVDLVEFPNHLLDNRHAQEFGCEPDNDAYEGGAQRAAPAGVMKNYRSAGGHLHIGTDTGFNCPPFIVALLCDAYIGAYEAVMRRDNGEGYMFYRRPGLYREKEYGIEYRSPGNTWVFNNQHAWRLASKAIAIGRFCSERPAKEIRTLIENIDWLFVRAKIMGQTTTPEQWREHKQTMRSLAKFDGGR